MSSLLNKPIKNAQAYDEKIFTYIYQKKTCKLWEIHTMGNHGRFPMVFSHDFPVIGSQQRGDYRAPRAKASELKLRSPTASTTSARS
jgi:hypothetical protein